MLTYADFLTLIISTLEQSGLPLREPMNGLTAQTQLFGTQGILDSLGLVSFLLDVEQEVNAHLSEPVTLVDEKAMSQRHSPFRSMGSLAEYLTQLTGKHE